LGAAASFALLAVGTITINGEGISISGDVGSNSAVTGDAQGDVVGTIDVGSQNVDNALGDAIAVWKNARALQGVQETAPKGTHGTILNGDVFTPGVYNFPAQIFIEGNITLR
jgi:predicted TIM-barrel enzyme